MASQCLPSRRWALLPEAPDVSPVPDDNHELDDEHVEDDVNAGEAFGDEFEDDYEIGEESLSPEWITTTVRRRVEPIKDYKRDYKSDSDALNMSGKKNKQTHAYVLFLCSCAMM